MAKLRLIYNEAQAVNSSETIIPYNLNGVFSDSWLGYDPLGVLFSIDPTLWFGLYMDIKNGQNYIGTYTNNIGTDNAINAIIFNGAGITSGTSGGNSGQHLNVAINGSNYKINLNLP